MVEKAGHKGTMRIARQQWIDESKPKAATAEDDEDYRIHQGPFGPQQADRVAPIFENAAKTAGERAKTPSAEDLFGDDDIYNATPRRNTDGTVPSRQVVDNDIPDEDDLDALMAEAEAKSGAKTQQTTSGPTSAPFKSIFGNGGGGSELDDDELDALMAEAEAEVPSGSARPGQPAAGTNIFGDGKSKQQATQGGGDEEDDLDALMAEAEAEAEAGAAARPWHDTKVASSARADTGQSTVDFDDDEQALAEMDGLW
jgi:replication fork protection complex subunit Csm3/Swi3